MPLREAMERISHAEYLVWQAWLQKQWNTPSRTDHYLMQIALEINKLPYRIFGGEWKAKLDSFRIPFKFVKTQLGKKRPRSKPKLNIEQIASWAKARWFGMLGTTMKRVLQEQEAKKQEKNNGG